jgi:hypothetical protein
MAMAITHLAVDLGDAKQRLCATFLQSSYFAQQCNISLTL